MSIGIRGKLFASFGTLIGLMAAVGYVGWQNTHEFAIESENLIHDQVKSAANLANAQSALWELRYGFPQFMVDPTKRAKIVADDPKLTKVIQDNLKEYASGNRTPQEKQAYQEWNEISTKYFQARPRWFELQGAGKIKEAAEWRAATTTPFGAGSVKALDQLIELQRNIADNKEKEILAKESSLKNLLLFTLALATLLGIALTILISRSITTPVLKSVKTIASSSSGIGATVQQQERTISQQAASVNQTTTTMEELGASSRQSAEQAETFNGKTVTTA